NGSALRLCFAPLRICVAGHRYSCRGRGFAWMKREIIAYFELHSIDLCQKAGGRKAGRQWIGLDLAQVSQLGLEMADAVLGRLKLCVVGNHGFSPLISMMPRKPPPRFACQYSTAACSPSKQANCRSQKTLAPNWDCAPT